MEPKRYAYADPPYPGQARKHYAHDARCAEVNHRVLIGYLADNFDGWALSTSTPALEEVLSLCREVVGPNRVRVAAWVKPFASFKPGVNPGYCWEPVILFGIRSKRDRSEPTVRDYVSSNITLKRGLSGTKPDQFCWWLFDVLGMQHGDEFTDVFPGSGAVSSAYRSWSQHSDLYNTKRA